jgi:hypothetical protein
MSAEMWILYNTNNNREVVAHMKGSRSWSFNADKNSAPAGAAGCMSRWVRPSTTGAERQQLLLYLNAHDLYDGGNYTEDLNLSH